MKQGLLNSVLFLVLACSTLLFSGCNQQAALQAQDQKISELEKRIENLQTVITNQALSARFWSDQIIELQKSVRQLESTAGGAYTEMDLSTTGGFTPAQGRFGIFLLSVKNVEPYLDGYRVSFEVGNPQFATFSDLRLKTIWGAKYDDSKATNVFQYMDDYNASLKRKEFSMADNLSPGSWNKVSIVLSPAKPEELGYFAISFDARMVSLSNPRN